MRIEEPSQESSRIQKILKILFQGRQKGILQFLDMTREYIKNSVLMPLSDFIADCYETCREMFGNFHLEMHDPLELPEMSPEEELEDTTTMFSDILESLRRVDPPQVVVDSPDSYEDVLEKQYQEFLEDINMRTSSVQPENNGSQDLVSHHIEVYGGSTVSINKPSFLEKLIREKVTSLSDAEEDDELQVQEEFQRKLAEQSQRYQEELEAMRRKRRQQH
ncbi:unnamed protein product [Caenorhabditis brenneri]